MFHQIWGAIQSTQSLFRAYRNESDKAKTGKPKPKAFYRRQDELGLSVALTKESALASLREVPGMCVFTAAHVYGCPHMLSLVQDTAVHAEIRGVPTMAEDAQRAIDIALYLVDVANDEPV